MTLRWPCSLASWPCAAGSLQGDLPPWLGQGREGPEDEQDERPDSVNEDRGLASLDNLDMNTMVTSYWIDDYIPLHSDGLYSVFSRSIFTTSIVKAAEHHYPYPLRYSIGNPSTNHPNSIFQLSAFHCIVVIYRPSIHHSTYLSIHPSIYLSICLSTYVSIYLSIVRSICL